MRKDDEERRALGLRLKAGRVSKGLSQASVAEIISEEMGLKEKLSYKTVSAWETGRGLPDVLTLRKLAKLYGESTDSLLWDDAPSNLAMQVAAQFDNLTVKQQETFRAVWMAFVENAIGDDVVEQRMPVTKKKEPEKKEPEKH